MNAALSAPEMNRIAEIIQTGPYDEYPAQENRLFLGAAGLKLVGNTLFVPEGPWHICGHSNRQDKPIELLDPEVPSPEHAQVDPDLSERWRQAGFLLDQHGRAIHPDWQQLLADKRIGLPTGLGFFWRGGPNPTVDGAVYRYLPNNEPELLLIKRARGGRWALPGGFIDRDDVSAEGAARREISEETHLESIGGTEEIILHKRPVGLCDTLHAWTENTVVLIHGNQEYLFDTEPVAGDDAAEVGWFKRQDIDRLEIFDAHPQYIDLTFSHLTR